MSNVAGDVGGGENRRNGNESGDRRALTDGGDGDGADEADDDRPRVAIACQGGGSHTAFTADVLKRVLREYDAYELVGLSGTSGGALNAVAAWYGLQTGGPEKAIDRLEAVWTDIAADDVSDRITNDLTVWTRRVGASGFPLPQASPYYLPGTSIARTEFRRLIERHVDFEAVRELCKRSGHPELVIGTVDVNGGEFETFTNESVTVDAVLASAAVPDLFRAVEIHGHYHWDGLFSQNPPVNDLMNVSTDRKPDELWIVQINPQTREGEPTSAEEIADRRNELSGNISLNQELRFIETVNEWIDAGHLPESDFSRTDIHRIEMGRAFHCATKVDRSPAFLRELIELGEQRAEEFLDERF